MSETARYERGRSGYEAIGTSLNRLVATNFNLEGAKGPANGAPIASMALRYDDAPAGVRVTVTRMAGAPADKFLPLDLSAGAFRRTLEESFGHDVKVVPQTSGNENYTAEFMIEGETSIARVLEVVKPLLPVGMGMRMTQEVGNTEVPAHPGLKGPNIPLKPYKAGGEITVNDLLGVVNDTVSGLIRNTDAAAMQRGTKPDAFKAQMAYRTGPSRGKLVNLDTPLSNVAVRDTYIYYERVPTAIPTSTIMGALDHCLAGNDVTRQGERLEIPMTALLGQFRSPQR